MNKFAFLFGNSEGLLGVQKDLQTFRDYLMSDIGGAWDKCEISELYENLSIYQLREKLFSLKLNEYDYLIIYFSGHGGSVRDNTYIYPNIHDYIKISELKNIAKRQLNIYDCCRSVDENIKKSIKDFSTLGSKNNKISIREIFNKRIEQAVPQQTSLFSCSLGECSFDKKGGVFTRNLLKAAHNINGSEKLVFDAYREAMKTTQDETLDKQTPKCEMANLSPEQQLVISINPRLIK